MAWIDAPVSGGAPGVANKTLVVMCGGERDAFEQVASIVASYAGRCTLMGPTGAGQMTKLVNQAICGVAFAALAEITALAKRAGINVAEIPAAIAGGRANSRLLQEYMPRMATDDRTRSGRIDNMLKDLDMVAELGRETGSSLPLTSLAREIHRLIVTRGMGAEDPAALIAFFE